MESIVLSVQIPNNNIEERLYTIQVLFNDILGIPYRWNISETGTDYVFSFLGKTLVMKDSFWNHFPIPLSYLKSDHFPKVTYATLPLSNEKKLPILYGNPNINITDTEITCEIDIISSIFFMITRWEEYCNPIRDQYNRFPGTESIAYQYHFLNRPLVNEYAELFWNLLQQLQFPGCRKEKKFRLHLTHDIDALQSHPKLISFVGDIIKRKNPKMAVSRCKPPYIDPYDTYNFLMNKSEQLGIRSTFYFMASDYRMNPTFPSNYLNTKKFKEVVTNIQSRNHCIGFHPGYTTYNHPQKWHEEKQKLETALGFSLTYCRQHYLLVDIPKIFTVWENEGMKNDSTLGYADQEGFRCGTGDRYPLFDFLNRKRLQVYELPLIVMDGTLNQHKKLAPKQAEECLLYYINIGKKYHMDITFLFHNSSFDNFEWNGWKKIYENLNFLLS